jgi:hypothetical protein
MTPMNRSARIIIIYVLPSVLILALAYLSSHVNEFSWVATAAALLIALLQVIIGLEQLRLAASPQKPPRGQTIKNLFARRFRIYPITLVILVLLELATLFVAYNPLRIFSGPAPKWTYQTGGPIASSPSVPDNGMVYVGSDDDYLYALDAASGKFRWDYQTGGAIHSSPQVVNGVLYVGSDDGRLYAFGPLF